jgi:PAS domain S-box-containing protein
MIDIQDREQAQHELQRLFDAVPQHIVVLRGDGRRLYANQAVLDYHGLTWEQFLVVDHSQCFHPDDLEAYDRLRQSGIESGEPWEAEVRLHRKDGQYRWFLIRARPLQDQQGRVIRWYLARTDIEDRKQAEEALRRSESYLAEAQRLSHTGSFAHDPARGEITYWSEESYRTFGFDPAAGPVSYAEARSRVHPDDLKRFDEYRERGIREKTGCSIDFRLLLPDGSIKHVHCVSRPVFNTTGTVVELVGTNMDVTEQHQARAALEKAFDEIKQLKDELYRENLALKEEIDQASMFEEIVGTSPVLRRVLVQVAKVAPTDSTVLIAGETGTGKELIARAIHKRSQRSTRAFVSVNCAAIPQALIGSELFGHEKGAFTGATQRRLGRFELADGGTLFLDEVGDLPAETQISLLRVLQERQFERIGGNQPIAVDVRIIAATHRDLKAAINAGAFRSDLYYRLSVFPIGVPPLRERKDDIPLLVEYLIERYASKAGKKIKNIHKRTLELFQAYDWPGNIRELQNVIERAVILCDGETFSVDELWLQSESPGRSGAGHGLARIGADQERELIESALTESRGRVAGPSGAATRLGIPRSTLETKIRRLGIDKHRFNSN